MEKKLFLRRKSAFFLALLLSSFFGVAAAERVQGGRLHGGKKTLRIFLLTFEN